MSERKSWQTWLIGAMFSVLLAAGSCVASATTEALSEMQRQQSAGRERIATVEAEYKALSGSVQELKDNDKQINSKLDELLKNARSKR